MAGNSVRLAYGYVEELRVRAAPEAIIAERLQISRQLRGAVARSIGFIALQACGCLIIDTQPQRAGRTA